MQNVLERSLCLKSPVPVITDSALLLQTKAALEKVINDLREQQSFLFKSFPFVNINLLRDEDQLTAKIYELNEHINYYETHLARFESQLKELIISKTN